MAGGFAKDGAVQDQIDASVEDAVSRARSRIPRGESLRRCEECDNSIDDDCDGVIDEDATGAGESCTIPGLLGACADGVTSCEGGPLVCVGPEPAGAAIEAAGAPHDCLELEYARGDKVFLPVEESGEAKCPYCGAEYHLLDDD